MPLLERLRRLDDRVLGPAPAWPDRYVLGGASVLLVADAVLGQTVTFPWPGRWRSFVLLVLGVAAGWLLQTRSRRDLVERLSRPSACILLLSPLVLVPRGKFVVDVGAVGAAAGFVGGLVQGELHLRRRDRRKALEPSR